MYKITFNVPQSGKKKKSGVFWFSPSEIGKLFSINCQLSVAHPSLCVATVGSASTNYFKVKCVSFFYFFYIVIRPQYVFLKYKNKSVHLQTLEVSV